MNCTKRIKGGEGGLPCKVYCNEPAVVEIRKGMHLCNKHFTAHLRNSIPWDERKEYTDVTPEQFENGRYMKLRESNSRLSYYFIKGVIKSVDANGIHLVTDIEPNINLFVTKKIDL